METIDPSQAARVWQRVRGESPEDEEGDLAQLIIQEWEDAAIYLQLSRRWGGKEAPVLYQLFRQEQNHCACLKGIYTMLTGTPPKLRAVRPMAEPLEVSLRKCYAREMRALSAYETRSADPNYGHVFSRMRDQEQEHCRVILTLLGGLGRK